MDVKVEIAFDSGFTTPEDSRTWTDVSDRIEGQDSIDITRGRGDERSEIDASTMTVTLDNKDGAFTPGNASSPYYPNVKKGRPIRLTVTYGDIDYIRFTGYVDEWPVEWPDGGDEAATTTLKASSRMARMSQSAELKSILEHAILDSTVGPVAYFVLNEPEGAPGVADSSPTGLFVPASTGVVFGQAEGVPTDNYAAAMFGGAGAVMRSDAPTALAASRQFTLFGFFRTTNGRGTLIGVSQGPLHSEGASLVLGVDNGDLGVGKTPYAAWVDAQQLKIAGTGSGALDGNTHFAACVLDLDASTLVVYFDDHVTQTFTLDADAFAFAPFRVLMGDISVGTVTLMHLGVVPRVMTTDELAAISQAGRVGGAGQASGERIATLAQMAGVPADEVDADDGMSTSLVAQPTDGAAAVELMQAVAATESGVLFDTREGHLAFFDRARRYQAQSAFTLDAGAQEVETGLTPVLDDLGMVNESSVTGGPSGTLSASATNPASIDDYGVYRTTADLLSDDRNELLAAADWAVSRFSEPRVRIPTVPLDVLNADVDLQGALLAADIDTRMTIVGLPAQAPAASMEFIIEGYAESITATSHSLTLNVSAADVYDVLILDDATRGKLDSTYMLGY